jgi:N-acetylglutamate synthase-like GNAT family acetyltransferase
MHYRRATPADAEPIADLVERSYAGYVPLIGLRPAPMDADYPTVVETMVVWVAEDSGRLVGVIVLEVEAAADHLLIENVAVSPEAQGLGIGSRLLQIAEDEATAAGLSELRLFTHELMTENLAYYGRRGYVETHRLTENGFSRVFLSKRLAPPAPA